LAGQAGLGSAGCGGAGRGRVLAGRVSLVWARCGVAYFGRQGEAWPGRDSLGAAWIGRLKIV
jgi:hypothetical protein